MIAEDIDAAIPDDHFVNDCEMQGEGADDRYGYSLLLQLKGVFILLFCINHDLHSSCC